MDAYVRSTLPGFQEAQDLVEHAGNRFDLPGSALVRPEK